MIAKLAALIYRVRLSGDNERYNRLCNTVYDRMGKHVLWAALDMLRPAHERLSRR